MVANKEESYLDGSQIYSPFSFKQNRFLFPIALSVNFIISFKIVLISTFVVSLKVPTDWLSVIKKRQILWLKCMSFILRLIPPPSWMSGKFI